MSLIEQINEAEMQKLANAKTRREVFDVLCECMDRQEVQE